MAAFATNADLGERLGITLTATEQTRADGLLAKASGVIRFEAGQTIERVVGDTLTRRGHPGAYLRLPERPVESVSSVTIDGDVVDPDEYWLSGDELVRLSGWGQPDEELVVVYTHGWAEIPELVKATAVEMVVRVWVNPGSVQQEMHGSESAMYPVENAVGLMLTDREAGKIRDLVRRSQGSVKLR